MCVVACDELGKLAQTGEEAEPGVEYTNVFDGFHTDEFIQKVIRVRPISGATHGDETKDGRASNVSKGAMGSEGADDPEDTANQNRIMNLEMEEQRKAIKLRQREILEEQRRKEALLAKQAEKKK